MSEDRVVLVGWLMNNWCNISIVTFGCECLSQSQPHAGAVMA